MRARDRTRAHGRRSRRKEITFLPLCPCGARERRGALLMCSPSFGEERKPRDFCNHTMRGDAWLVVSPPSSRYAALHELELRKHGCASLGSRLWRIPPSASLGPLVSSAASADDLLVPLRRATSLGELLRELAEGASNGDEEAPWTLRYADHARGQHTERAQECLCAVARFLPGPPALLPGVHTAKTRDLVLVRSRRLWYLAESQSHHRHRRTAADALWALRPYSFSAATDLALAQLALSLALQAHASTAAVSSSEATALPFVLDPCCGGGTILFAAAQRGLPSMGWDCNPMAVSGARDNLEHAATSLGWSAEQRPAVLEHDTANDGLPSGAPPEDSSTLVVANLPWGREQRLDHHFHIRDLLASVAPAGATFALLSGESISPTIRECGLRLIDELSIGRCVLSISRRDTSTGLPPMPSAEARPAVVAPALQVLCGGGLRGGLEAAETTPAMGDEIAVQHRSVSGGRVWRRARIVSVQPSRDADGGDGWRCLLAWHDAKQDDEELILARNAGPNWRFEAPHE